MTPTTRPQLGTFFRDTPAEEENWPQIALATERFRAIDLSHRACDACGAGCWVLGLDSRWGSPLRSVFTPNLRQDGGVSLKLRCRRQLCHVSVTLAQVSQEGSVSRITNAVTAIGRVVVNCGAMTAAVHPCIAALIRTLRKQQSSVQVRFLLRKMLMWNLRRWHNNLEP